MVTYLDGYERAFLPANPAAHNNAKSFTSDLEKFLPIPTDRFTSFLYAEIRDFIERCSRM